jgi:spore coat polysaccharide biosynthesis protein SpsF (cytidylyltransferase family)
MILIQARSNSSRFPNKIMEEIDALPMIHRVFEQATASGYPAMVLISDGDPVRDYLRKNHIPFFEGDEKDVISRYYDAAKTFGLPWVVRVTGDCPLIDPATIAFLIQIGTKTRADFVSNCIQECTDGQEVEFISFRLLERITKDAKTPTDREHVTTYIKKKQKDLEKEFSFIAYSDPRPIGPKMSVDTPQDLENVRAMFAEMKNRKRQYA